MSRLDVSVYTTNARRLYTGDVVTASADITALYVQNGLCKVTMEVAGLAVQRGASHPYRMTAAGTWQRMLDVNYGDYTYFTNTPAARPDQITVVEATGERVELAIEWTAYNLVDAGTFPSGIANRDYANGLNYSQGAVNPNWKYITTTRLVKSIVMLRGREGYFVGYHSDPLIGPVASRIPTDNNETSWGEREIGTGLISAVSFSSASVTGRHPSAGAHVWMGIDDPVANGGAEQTTGPWWVAAVPPIAGTQAGLCIYIAARQRLQVGSYQFDPAHYGNLVFLGVNEAHDSANVPYRTMLFIGAFEYTAQANLANEPTAAVRAAVSRRCPSTFDSSGVADDTTTPTTP